MISLSADEKFDIDILLTLVREPNVRFTEQTYFSWEGTRASIVLSHYGYHEPIGWRLLQYFPDGNVKRLGLGISEIRDLFADPGFRRTHGLGD